MDGMEEGEPLEAAALKKPPPTFDPDWLAVYYKRLFPYSEMCKWLSYGNDRSHPECDQTYLGRREISFTLADDIYVRYQSFKDEAAMAKEISERCPHKIDIGAVFNVDPAKRTTYQGGDRIFAPVERELVFDVDMTDYDDVRTCCSGADVCPRCWPLMTVAVKVLNTALREDFGFEHLLWVYSGRRGVHCWVCDASARRLTNEQRSSVAEYFRVYKGGDNNSKKVTLSGAALHPSLTRAYEQVLRHYFEDVMAPSQNLLATPESWQKVLAQVPDEDVRARLNEKWASERRSLAPDCADVSTARWKQLESTVRAALKKNGNLRRCVEEIVFAHVYPRLDLEVSKNMNHLLKAPFCVHPKTGKVCVPIDPDRCEDFDPGAVPTLSQLMEELSASTEVVTSRDPKARDSKKASSLDEAVSLMHRVFLDPLLQTCKEELTKSYQAKLQERATRTTLAW